MISCVSTCRRFRSWRKLPQFSTRRLLASRPRLPLLKAAITLAFPAKSGSRSRHARLQYQSGVYLRSTIALARVSSRSDSLRVASPKARRAWARRGLITAGRQLASRASLPLSFSRTDVLGPRPLIPSDDPASCHVALHACGGLHRSALRNAVHAGAEVIAIAPCCFHKWPDDSDEANEQWQPLSSTAASHSKLSINYEELRLACAGEAAAKRRDERLRLREMKWRLAFGVWHRRAHLRNRRKQQRSTTTTTASVDWSAASRLPSVPLPLLSQGSSGEVSIDGFREFCKWGATVKGESLPVRKASGLEHAVEDGVWSDDEAEACLRIGEARASKVARLELVRHAYRRPLEQWLVLDLCLYLEEQGYAVTMKRFCEPLTSPRNLLVLGERSKA